MDHAVVADLRLAADGHVRMQHRARPDPRAVADDGKRADRGALADRGAGRDIGKAVNAGGRPPRVREELDGFGEREVGMARAQDRARGAFRAIAGNDGRRARPLQRHGVLGIAEKRQVAGAGILNPGDAVDLDVAVPFKTTAEPLR